MTDKPLEVYNVHDYLRTKLCNLYESDSIFGNKLYSFNLLLKFQTNLKRVGVVTTAVF
jgi:hypothetical protein